MTKYISILLALGGFSLAGFAQAQQGSVAGPVAGFVFDRGAQALRPLPGIPGASTVGGPISSGYQLTAAYVAPRLDSVFGVAADGSTHYFTLSSTTLSEVSIDGLMAQPERVAFSASGAAAVLYSSGQAQMVVGLPGSPSLAGSLALRQGARAIHPTSLAISDDGAYLLFAVGGSIQLASQSGGVRAVISAGAGASVAFAPGAHDAAIAARGTGVMMIRDVPGSAVQQNLAVDDGSFEVVAGLGFSQDGARVFVATAAAQPVIVLDLSGNRTSVACACSPTELAPMGNAFRLNELGAGPLWLADAGLSGPRTVFVPALVAAQ
jgi:hypothetical protein